ncbi:hypothetical protein BABINDRAFT_161471 [Babjeviella inositovora NRRL Y-12698]|uniref:glucan endo-1,3-beta-D-glucosidase n=1 Tax=Babjeviella inositovora NRRL Y-12698 TaxID=984486 RepID=A0A1E3QRV7_9ASCO|nr:uncharacterized protein BABINDRAFT_161471 [Babjeviella inositovora NRRL Y-12698]ODQ79772.1 hypothetical protein BABINDRAFT_161471 [Babjeviella inositovora NRRL Y-12698]
MKFTACSAVAILASLKAVSAACSLVGGNYYCDQTNAVLYSGVGYSGSYQDVTNMDESTCKCLQSEVSFSGNLSPLDEELSVHFRGPLQLLNFAVYYPSASSNEKREVEDCTTKVHGHSHKKRAVKIIEVTNTVYVDQKGNPITQVISNTHGLIAGTSVNTVKVTSSIPDVASVLASAPAAAASSTGATVAAGAWQRTSYFTPGSTSNVTFLNTLGGSESGVWSSCFGNSLSYCAADGVSAAASAQPLNQVTIGSDIEYSIFSGSSCDDSTTGDCGYYREGIPAYHGFGGDTKIFAFEFQMPTASTSDSSASNYDMPAIWLLNAKIPRTLQYGDASCSCWSTGCGELDLFEILSSGSQKLISHLHSGQGSNGSAYGGGGSQDYFARPTSSSMKAVVIFNGSASQAKLVVVDNTFDFATSLTEATVNAWLTEAASSAILV